MTRVATRRDLFAGPLCLLGFGFGSGLAPVAPGTFGTLAAIPLYLALVQFGALPLFIATVAICVVGIPICEATARQLGVHDHGAIVWDEIAGFLLTMVLVVPTVANLLAGFVLFRLFDIVKPWPIRAIDRKVEGGLGIMLDDIVAAVFAGLALWLLNAWNPGSLFY